MTRRLALLLVPWIAACSDKGARSVEGEPGGTVVIATTTDPGTLFPPVTRFTSAKQITEQIYDYLADVGPDMNTLSDEGFRPQLSDRWRWSNDSLMLAFHINPRAKWHDGRDVTARDVQFTLSLYKNPALGGGSRTELANIDSVTVTDSLTAVFWFHQRAPSQFLDAAAQMLILPAHQLEKISVDSLRESAPAPIGSGRFRFRARNTGASVEIVADTSNYRGRAMLDRVIWSVATEHTAAVTKLFSGDADLYDGLRVEDQTTMQRHSNLKTMVLPGAAYVFMQFNLQDPANHARPHSLFVDRNLRRAITMSIDRNSLVKSVFDTFAVVPAGPTVRMYPTTDPRIVQLPFDTVRAGAIFDSLGWIRRHPDGMRSRSGQELGFRLLVPGNSLNRIRMGVLIQEQLRRMGIRIDLDQMEVATFSARLSTHAFDAVLGVWTMGASPDGTRAAWTTVGVGKDGTNYGSYSNRTFDVQFDSALASDPAHAREKFTA
ncbi:MAG TPA: peptide ABC transporter substrate-binding protein, partial [Gemmatimonadaceae bacterium]|nr:peptide ABC transporter substrate-binding protein [Gemmatimonadaceae bacterium]